MGGSHARVRRSARRKYAIAIVATATMQPRMEVEGLSLMGSRWVPRAQVIGAALLFSTGGLGIKVTHVTPWQVAAFRSGFAALALAFFLPASRAAWNRRTLLVGCAYAIQGICFALGNKFTTAANTIFLEATAPLYVVLLGPLLLGETRRARDLAVLALVAVGLALILFADQPPAVSAPDPALGNLLGLLSGVGWALTVLGLRWLARDGRPGEVVAAVVTGNAIALLIAIVPALPVHDLSVTDAAVLAYLGVFQIGAAYLLLTVAVRRLQALEVSLLLLVEPVFNPLWAWLGQGETPALGALAGGALILAGVTAKAALDGREPARPAACVSDEDAVPETVRE